jgi:hypothetical protein
MVRVLPERSFPRGNGLGPGQKPPRGDDMQVFDDPAIHHRHPLPPRQRLGTGGDPAAGEIACCRPGGEDAIGDAIRETDLQRVDRRLAVETERNRGRGPARMRA